MTQTTIKATHILTTPRVVLTAWEPTDGLAGAHGSISTIDGAWVGNVATRRLPAEIEALPAGSEKRFEAALAWREALRSEIVGAIRDALACPSLLGLPRWSRLDESDRTEVVLWFDDVETARAFGRAFGERALDGAVTVEAAR